MFVEYLRRVGADYKASGSEYTAADYRQAADWIEAVESELREALLRIKRLEAFSDDPRRP